MKYVIRKGVFETNSSSTHSMVLLMKGSKEEREYNSQPVDEDVVNRTISSKLYKALLLYQFYYHYVGYYTFYDADEYEQENMETFDEWDLEIYREKKEQARKFQEKVFKDFTDEKDFKLIKEIVEKTQRFLHRYKPACNLCFQNDVLDECFCGMSYEKIAEVVGVDLNEENSEDKIIEKVLSDDYYFDIGEVYYGGYWDDDFPNDF